MGIEGFVRKYIRNSESLRHSIVKEDRVRGGCLYLDFMVYVKAMHTQNLKSVQDVKTWFASKVNFLLSDREVHTLYITFDRGGPPPKGIHTYTKRYKLKARVPLLPPDSHEPYLGDLNYLPTGDTGQFFKWPMAKKREKDGEEIDVPGDMASFVANSKLTMRELGPIFTNTLLDSTRVFPGEGKRVIASGLPIMLRNPGDTSKWSSTSSGDIPMFLGPLSSLGAREDVSWNLALEIKSEKIPPLCHVLGCKVSLRPDLKNEILEGDLQIPFLQMQSGDYAKEHVQIIANDGDYIPIQLLFFHEHRRRNLDTFLILLRPGKPPECIHINALYDAIQKDEKYLAAGVQNPIVHFVFTMCIIAGTDFYRPSKVHPGMGVEKNVWKFLEENLSNLSHLIQLTIDPPSDLTELRIPHLDEVAFSILIKRSYINKWGKGKGNYAQIRKSHRTKTSSHQHIRMSARHAYWNLMYWLNGWKARSQLSAVTYDFKRDGLSVYGYDGYKTEPLVTKTIWEDVDNSYIIHTQAWKRKRKRTHEKEKANIYYFHKFLKKNKAY